MAETSQDALEHRIRRLENKGDSVNKLWHEMKTMSIPLVEVGVIIGIAITGYVWADDLDDAQKKTQDQLNQLVTLVAENVKENKTIHKDQSESLASIQTSLELMALEARLRRELEAARAASTN